MDSLSFSVHAQYPSRDPTGLVMMSQREEMPLESMVAKPVRKAKHFLREFNLELRTAKRDKAFKEMPSERVPSYVSPQTPQSASESSVHDEDELLSRLPQDRGSNDLSSAGSFSGSLSRPTERGGALSQPASRGDRLAGPTELTPHRSSEQTFDALSDAREPSASSVTPLPNRDASFSRRPRHGFEAGAGSRWLTAAKEEGRGLKARLRSQIGRLRSRPSSRAFFRSVRPKALCKRSSTVESLEREELLSVADDALTPHMAGSSGGGPLGFGGNGASPSPAAERFSRTLVLGSCTRYADPPYSTTKIVSVMPRYIFLSKLPFPVMVREVRTRSRVLGGVMGGGRLKQSLTEMAVHPGESKAFHGLEGRVLLSHGERCMASSPFSLVPPHVPTFFQVELVPREASAFYGAQQGEQFLIVQVSIVSGLFGDVPALPYSYNGSFIVLSLPDYPQFVLMNLSRLPIAYESADRPPRTHHHQLREETYALPLSASEARTPHAKRNTREENKAPYRVRLRCCARPRLFAAFWESRCESLCKPDSVCACASGNSSLGDCTLRAAVLQKCRERARATPSPRGGKLRLEHTLSGLCGRRASNHSVRVSSPRLAVAVFLPGDDGRVGSAYDDGETSLCAFHGHSPRPSAQQPDSLGHTAKATLAFGLLFDRPSNPRRSLCQRRLALSRRRRSCPLLRDAASAPKVGRPFPRQKKSTSTTTSSKERRPRSAALTCLVKCAFASGWLQKSFVSARVVGRGCQRAVWNRKSLASPTEFALRLFVGGSQRQ